MNYAALVNEEEHQVEITEVAAGLYRIVIDGRERLVDAQAGSHSSLSLINNNHAYNINLEPHATGGDNVLLRGFLVNIEVVDLRTLRLRKAQQVVAGPDGPIQIEAPMPGKVVDILVKEGQSVEQGQGLLIVEAMKMENELRAPRSGVVKNIVVKTGAAVESGVTLCVIE